MSPAQRCHPEFGYFCPTPDFRRRLRKISAFTILGAIAFSTGTLMLKAAHDPLINPMSLAVFEQSFSLEEGGSGERIGDRAAAGNATCDASDEGCVARKSRKMRIMGARRDHPMALVALGRNADRSDQHTTGAPDRPDQRQHDVAVAAEPKLEPIAQAPSAARRKRAHIALRQNRIRERPAETIAGSRRQAPEDQLRGRLFANARGHRGSYEARGPLGFLFR